MARWEQKIRRVLLGLAFRDAKTPESRNVRPGHAGSGSTEFQEEAPSLLSPARGRGGRCSWRAELAGLPARGRSRLPPSARPSTWGSPADVTTFSHSPWRCQPQARPACASLLFPAGVLPTFPRGGHQFSGLLRAGREAGPGAGGSGGGRRKGKQRREKLGGGRNRGLDRQESPRMVESTVWKSPRRVSGWPG